MDTTITINKQEYIMLVRMAERIDTLERLFEQNSYMSESAIRAILGIQKREEAEDDGEL